MVINNGKESVMSNKKFNLYKACFIINITLFAITIVNRHLQEKDNIWLGIMLFTCVMMLMAVGEIKGNKEKLLSMYKFYFIGLLIVLVIMTFAIYMGGAPLPWIIAMILLYAAEIAIVVRYSRQEKEFCTAQ